MDIKTKVAALSLSAAGALFIMSHEGVKTEAYPDPAYGKTIPTICVGHTSGVYMGQKATLAQCEEWLIEDSSVAGKAVKRLVKTPLTQKQYDALVSFTFNAGEGNFAKSTLLKKINSGDCVGAGNEFLKWNKSNGRVLRGLTKRRQGERAMWLSGCEKEVDKWKNYYR